MSRKRNNSFVWITLGVSICVVIVCSVLAIINTGLYGLFQTDYSPIKEGAFPLDLISSFQVDSEIRTPPTIEDDIVILRTETGVRAVHLKTGKMIWKVEIEGDLAGFSEPTIHNGIIYITNTQEIRAIDLKTGQVQWNRKNNGNGRMAGSPPKISTFANGLVFVQFPLYLEVLNQLTGEPVWNLDLGRRVNIILSNEKEIFNLWEEHLDALDPLTGSQLWSLEFNGGISLASYKDDKIYIALVDYENQDRTTDTTTLIAVDTEKQTEVWRQSLPENVLDFFVVSNRVFVSTRARIVSLDAITGQEEWTSDIGRDDYQRPILINDVIYVGGAFSHNIYALSARDGSYMGRLRTGTRSFFYKVNSVRPVTNNNYVIVPVKNKIFVYGNSS